MKAQGNRILRCVCTYAHVIYRYLYGVVKDQGVKLRQVLDMVALNHIAALSHQTS